MNDCGIRGYQNVCTEGFQSFGVESISVHNDFLMETLQNDIALLRLNTDIEFNLPNVKPICLPIGTAGRLLEQQVFLFFPFKIYFDLFNLITLLLDKIENQTENAATLFKIVVCCKKNQDLIILIFLKSNN